MKYRFLKILVSNSSEFEVELNSFLSSHRIICVDREFVSDSSSSFWSLCVEYDDTSGKTSPQDKKRSKIDYKEVLSEIAKLPEINKAVVSAINGIGEE